MPSSKARSEAKKAPLDESLERRLHDLEAVQKATFNILEDFAAEREKLSDTERATFNILDDFANEQARLTNIQRATFNLLDDFSQEKIHLEDTQRATFNILEDAAFERNEQDQTTQATFNILEDFLTERNNLENVQNAAFNILEDLNLEKDKLTQEVLDRKRAEKELASANTELEAFSYSVSHDLRAPLRGIDGFSFALLKDYGDKLDETGKEYLKFLRTSSQQMAQLIDDLLNLSRMSRGEVHHEYFNMADMAKHVMKSIHTASPERVLEFHTASEIKAYADPRLIRIVLENLLGNAFKFTTGKGAAVIELGESFHGNVPVYWIHDNGAGFDMTYADKLFGAFQRLHSNEEFPGTGIGLATVRRIVHRHGGRIWAEGRPGLGAKFSFTLSG